MMKLKVLYEDENKDEIVLMSSEGEIIPFSKELMKMDIKKEIDLENKIIKNNFSPIIENILKM